MSPRASGSRLNPCGVASRGARTAGLGAPLLFVVLWAWGPKLAALEWTCRSLELGPAVGELATAGAFSFRNTSENAVRILSVTPGCDCTTAEASRDFVAPGGRGEIRVLYRIGDKQGRQESTIAVITDETAQPLAILTLRINLPELLGVEPRVVEWRRGEASREKMVTVRAAAATGLRIEGLRSSDRRMAVRIENDADGCCRIAITPMTTMQSLQAVVTFQAVADGKARSEFIRVRIREPDGG